MERLSLDGEDLVEAGRAVLQPDEGDMERVQALLEQHLGPGTFGAGNGAATAARHGLILKLIVGAALVSGLGVVAVLLLERTDPVPSVASAPVVSASPSPLHPHEAEMQAAPAAESSVVAPPAAEPAASLKKPLGRTATPEDSLAQEVALLSRASSEVRAGRPAQALETLAQHQRLFPSGALSQERAAARIQALCGLGRRKEAQVELDRFTKRWPSSPLEPRARQSCGFAAAP